MTNLPRLGLLAVGLLLLSSGCQKQDTEKLAKLGRTLYSRWDSSLSEVRQRLPGDWKALLVALDTLGLEARVAARLRWDRSLKDASIRVEVDGTTVLLRGTVRDLGQRRRALELAETTAGVEHVEDKLDPSVR